MTIPIVAFAVLIPSFFLGNASGHDFEFHIRSWMDVARQWHQGTLFPRWAEWANYGYGEPRFIFYPPLSWIAGAALGLVLPWHVVPEAFIFLALCLAGASMLRFAREWLAPGEALFAAVLYAVNPYHLLVVYYRSDFAELAASAILPLAFAAALRAVRDGARGVAPLALSFAAIWLTNAPTAVVTSYALALLLVSTAILERSLRPLAVGAAGIALGLALAAFYIVPAAWEQRWVDIGQAVSPGLRPQDAFLFSSYSDPIYRLFNHKVSYLALGMMLFAGLAMVASDDRRHSARRVWWALAALGTVCSVAMFPWSLFLWNRLPKLHFVQFPWRLLVPLGVVFAFFLAAAVDDRRSRWIWRALLGLVLIASAFAMVRDAWWDTEDVPTNLAAVESGQGYEGTDEYETLGADRNLLHPGAPLVHVLTPAHARDGSGADVGRPRIHGERWAPEEKLIEVDSAEPVTLALRLLSYPAWRTAIDGVPATWHPQPKTGALELALAPGRHHIQIEFARTRDRTLGGLLSLCALAALAGVYVKWNRTGVIRIRAAHD